MHDLKWIRENPEALDRSLQRRGDDPVSAHVLEMDSARRVALTLLQKKQEFRNKISKQIGASMKAGMSEEAEQLKKDVLDLKAEMEEVEVRERAASEGLENLLASLPNILDDDVPEGDDEDDNRELRVVGTPPVFDFEPKAHFDLGEDLGLMDFEMASELSGSRFVILKGALARMERALADFMLDVQTEEFGYTEVSPPLMVKEKALFGTGQLPKFGDDLYRTKRIDYEALFPSVGKEIDEWLNNEFKKLPVLQPGSPDFGNQIQRHVDVGISKTKELLNAALESGEFEDPYWLIPTAEVPLTNMVAGKILEETELPYRVTAHTACFRAEAGAAGKDTRGMLRQHQFYKVELVSVVKPEDSEAELDRMTGCAEEILKRLGLAYRVVVLCSGDTGFGAAKTHDLEVWMPGQDTYREISSVSNTRGFQARRMNARYRPSGDGQAPEHVHTLNGSGVAVGRALIAVLENYQNADGSITIPEALRPYMGGREVIRADV